MEGVRNGSLLTRMVYVFNTGGLKTKFNPVVFLRDLSKYSIVREKVPVSLKMAGFMVFNGIWSHAVWPFSVVYAHSFYACKSPHQTLGHT